MKIGFIGLGIMGSRMAANLQRHGKLASTTAYENGIALPAVNLAKEIYGLAERQGLGPQDFAAVYRWLRQSQE